MTARDTAPWRALRDLEPGLGSRRRVLANIEAALDADAVRSPSRARGAIALAAAAVALVVALAWRSGPAVRTRAMSGGDTPIVASAGDLAAGGLTSATVDAARLAAAPAAGDEQRHEPASAGPELRLDRDDSLAVDLPGAAITVIGPAAVQVTGDILLLHRGRVSVDGAAVVRGGSCDARVTGSADVETAGARLEVRVFAGSAEVTDDTACSVTIVDLEAPADPVRPEPTRVEPPPEETAEATAPPAEPEAAGPSEMRQQVEAFRAARALSGADALDAWRAIVERWPDSPLREEADAAVIDALVAGGRAADARAAAAAFIARYPRSPRAELYRPLAEEAP